ncbi:uncharacterized protein LOC143277094 [Babylonia areolata]|uniref:uncharacterized protein LOC143277094 n=1 Tax=Babylonia areolata TaxID=304850 RepID=UPI003FCFEA99
MNQKLDRRLLVVIAFFAMIIFSEECDLKTIADFRANLREDTYTPQPANFTMYIYLSASDTVRVAFHLPGKTPVSLEQLQVVPTDVGVFKTKFTGLNDEISIVRYNNPASGQELQPDVSNRVVRKMTLIATATRSSNQSVALSVTNLTGCVWVPESSTPPAVGVTSPSSNASRLTTSEKRVTAKNTSASPDPSDVSTSTTIAVNVDNVTSNGHGYTVNNLSTQSPPSHANTPTTTTTAMFPKPNDTTNANISTVPTELLSAHNSTSLSANPLNASVDSGGETASQNITSLPENRPNTYGISNVSVQNVASLPRDAPENSAGSSTLQNAASLAVDLPKTNGVSVANVSEMSGHVNATSGGSTVTSGSGFLETTGRSIVVNETKVQETLGNVDDETGLPLEHSLSILGVVLAFLEVTIAVILLLWKRNRLCPLRERRVKQSPVATIYRGVTWVSYDFLCR